MAQALFNALLVYFNCAAQYRTTTTKSLKNNYFSRERNKILTLRGREASNTGPANFARCNFRTTHNRANILACLESLSFAIVYNVA